MSYGERKHQWSVYDGVKAISVAPEALMAEINSAITALEYARAAVFSPSPDPAPKARNTNRKPAPSFDAQIVDEAYKAGLASMSAGRVDEAIISLNLALSKCPPEKTSALAKIQSLISVASQQRHKYRVLYLVAVEINGEQWIFDASSALDVDARVVQKRCKSLSSALREKLSKCPFFAGKLSGLSSEAEDSARDFDEEDEVFVSAVMSRYMESKCRRKSMESRWALSPQHFLLARKGSRESRSSGGSGEEEEEEFSSAAARLSRCSSATSYDTFYSVKTRFSRSSSLNKIDSCKDFRRRRIIIQELMQYEGWPFGLCKKAFLLPPLPKSPSDSWSWRKNAGISMSVGSGRVGE